MSTLNETQRKYVRTRLAELLKQKRAEIQGKSIDKITWYNQYDATPAEMSAAQQEIVNLNAAFKNAGIDVVITNTQALMYMETAASKARRKEADENAKNIRTKLDELQKLYDSLMDDIMLGNDADSLKSALDKLASFSVN